MAIGMPSSNMGRIVLNLDRYEQGLRRRAELALMKLMLDFEAQAKTDHPYTDRSGANTASIRGFVASVTETEMVGVLSAGMIYSAVLEKAREGKYAYLMPVILRNKENILAVLKAAMEG